MNAISKMAITLVVIIGILIGLLALPVLIGFASVIMPVIAVIALIVFVPIAIGIVIGSSKKGGVKDD